MPSQWQTVSTSYIEEDPVSQRSRHRSRTSRSKPSHSASPVKRSTRPLPKVRVYEDIYDPPSADLSPSGDITSSQPIGIDHPYSDHAFIPFDDRTSQGKTTLDYMEEWVQNKCEIYLQAILKAEALGIHTCFRCGVDDTALWRCMDCMSDETLCRACCRSGHDLHPFHRIERWNGSFFQPAWLWHVGAAIFLGHKGLICPGYLTTSDELIYRCLRVNNMMKTDPTFSADPSYGAKPTSQALGNGKVMTVIHTNGLHHLPVYPCMCDKKVDVDIQLLHSRLYPASAKDPSTVFTFEALKFFHLIKVQTNLSTENYSTLLRRLTSFVFPDDTPDRQRELGRAWQQWNHLINLKRYGFGHKNRGRKPGRGDLALFCAACPQPNENLPDNWKDDPDTWKYRRYLVADGNFVLNHLRSHGLNKDKTVFLADGASYMSEKARYDDYVQKTTEYNEPSTCYEHRAVADKNKAKRGYDSTGLVAIACSRHGCFAPGSVVDMQKGERQLNVDYALTEACITTSAESTNGLLFAYDINCQYSVNFCRRIANSGLRFPPNLPVTYLIGLFHVHGHKEECLWRFAPSYLSPGAGVTSGEIIESLWSQLNGAANITRTMTVSHRQEMLDACMADINWRKLQGLVPFLIRQVKKAEEEHDEAQTSFEDADAAVTPEQRVLWRQQMTTANADRGSDPTSMDIYCIAIEKVEPKKDVQVRLMAQEQANNTQLGVTRWVAEAIDLQEHQMQLADLVRSHRRSPTPSQSVEIQKKREMILKKLNSTVVEGEVLFPQARLEQMLGRAPILREICLCNDECTCADEIAVSSNPRPKPSDVEHAIVPLPSSFDTRPGGWSHVETVEEQLRVGQAHEALEALRVEIAHKSYLYRANRGAASAGKKAKTRGYNAIRNVDKGIRFHVKRYDAAVWALDRLDVRRKYPMFEEIKPEHTKAVTNVYDPNARGQRDVTLSWIWTVHTKSNSPENAAYLAEVYRVNWIRATSRRDRWNEEVSLVKSEMDWFVRYCTKRSETALSWMGYGDGCDEYALRQADMWRRLGDWASAEFLLKAGVAVSCAGLHADLKPDASDVIKTDLQFEALDTDVKPIVHL